jgi:CRP/FNR family transcriptional regulator, nitrogen fixation regulation protein
MLRQVGGGNLGEAFDKADLSGPRFAQSGQLDELVALERIGSRRSFVREEVIYSEGDPSDCWYKVVAGTVRITKMLADGRRHIAEFYISGDSFGYDNAVERLHSAEAVGEVVVMRYSWRATERLLDGNPRLARQLRDMTLRGLAHAQTRMVLLGRLTAQERVANFILEMFEQRDATRAIDLPMSRTDIADYLGLTIETVSRALSGFKRDGIIAIPNVHRIELCDRYALKAIGEA